jgi:transcriptional repressor NF-X1
MYLENSTWAAAQEKALRLFAVNPDEKRLRFKPMPAQQRAFLHSIAEDFGLDSESMDPEPHRHVAIFKTPRFVMAPMKTLAECARIRQTQRTIAAPVQPAALPSRPKPSNLAAEPFNAFLITAPRFGLTIEEVNGTIKTSLPNPAVPLEIHFLPSEEVAIRPPLMTRVNIPDREVQAMLESMKPALSKGVSSAKLGQLHLARLDASLNVLRTDTDPGAGAGAGWSQVAAKGAGPRRVVQGAPIMGNKGGFAVLSLASKRKKQEKKELEVADDWETAELAEEEKEKAVSAGESASQSEVGSPVSPTFAGSGGE